MANIGLCKGLLGYRDLLCGFYKAKVIMTSYTISHNAQYSTQNKHFNVNSGDFTFLRLDVKVKY